MSPIEREQLEIDLIKADYFLAEKLREELQSELGYVRSMLDQPNLADTVRLMWQHRKEALEGELNLLSGE